MDDREAPDSMAMTERDHVRIKIDTRVFVEVIAPDEKSEGIMVKCDVLNVSYGGFSAGIKTEVPVNAILSVCVDLPGVKSPFYMAAEVKWCRPSDKQADEWLAGFKLLESSDSDIRSWQALLERV